ncbi:DMT family transporter [Pandoraea norimbergensis]|uniref:Multidrug DMT transporter n=1 Tax=Pandoraea norimbergensis TaxID=93219 RepID=A0ABN4JIR0_9BURK|nr:DMT family transporter [Pandoraea norimbergensis]ALS60815.1 multidrug DMT transporter [Pandoraea norimbergensis]
MGYILYPLGAMLLWAGNVIVSKLSASAIAPSAITFYRLVLAVAVLTPFVIRPLMRNWSHVRPQLAKLGFLGFLSMSFYQSLSYLAAHSTTATNMAIVTALAPLLTLLWSVALLREPPTLGMLVGGLMSLAGLVYLIGRGHPATLLDGGIHLGDVLMLIASASYGLYSVLLRRWHVALPSTQSAYVQACAALITMIPMVALVPAGQAQLNVATVPLVLYAGLGASILLPILWIQGIRHLGPNRCSMFINVLPVMTAVLAVLMLGEQLHTFHILGGGVALVGVAIAQRWKRPLPGFGGDDASDSDEVPA